MLCCADEVQTGFGRFGNCWWAFQQQEGAVPDIVTVGKPFGNGMPLAAVVCRKEVAASFAQGPEYFNTFGGNPVSCAAGLAVLDAIESGGLRQHAQVVGEYLKAQLSQLQKTPAGRVIGDIRGQGLFVGVELIRPTDEDAIAPAPAETSWVCSQLKGRHRILTSVDGPHHNVIVIKPPMVFDTSDVDRLVAGLADCFARLASADLGAVAHTPT